MTRAARTTIEVRGARDHNLRNVDVEIPRDKLTVVTGVSGSGKSSLAFDTIYAEGQRRYLESLSSFVRQFIGQIAKPDVDFVHGLSPVISIEQKTVGSNPRSTVGTLTDISNYLNLLFATLGQPHCPWCQKPVAALTTAQVVDAILALPDGAVVELQAPVFGQHGEDFEYVVTEVRRQGYRHMATDDGILDLSQPVDGQTMAVPDRMAVIIDRFSVRPGVEKQLRAVISNALLVGDQLLSVRVGEGTTKAAAQKFAKAFGCRAHGVVFVDVDPSYFMFNKPESACRTCGGLGMYKVVHEDLLVADPSRSIRAGCFVPAAFNYKPDNYDGMFMYSLGQKYGFDLDTPWSDLAPEHHRLILHGTGSETFPLQRPPEAKAGTNERAIGRDFLWSGVVTRIARHYRRYRERDVANSGMERWLDQVMVEETCPDCEGSRLKRTRRLFRLNGLDPFDVGQVSFAAIPKYLHGIDVSADRTGAGAPVLAEIAARVDLLLGIGLDYLNFNRRSSTLSGGEAQHIRLSTQIGSGLMGMLYVLDEPSIGLHPKDNEKMIATLRRLRDIGNTVIVVEHDEATIRAADHVIEMGPGPGVHGGSVVAAGKMKDILACKAAPTGQFLSGSRVIPLPERRRPLGDEQLVIRGASENNLQKIDVAFPLNVLLCVTGASGSGKSTLVTDILYKRLWKELVDSRTLAGAHDGIEGVEHVSRVVAIDQSAIGRNSRSNPATYVGFYDDIRKLFAAQPESKKRGYDPGRFSFNVAKGRCTDCSGEGVTTTQLYFMPDVESTCSTCKGARFNPGTLEITYRGKTIADVLATSIEEALEFFADVPAIARPVSTLASLGLGYLTLGQSATTLSGGEAQRVKLATELSKVRRAGHVLYILDEPTTGLHLADVERLVEALQAL
ncbi:MAG TPA: excinuclease ABC subunit UvrA, partial [Acidimicrobiales bacterium]|nr:excinuclease ABC subunit UvrA [Acidimicrobiales bacterium]